MELIVRYDLWMVRRVFQPIADSATKRFGVTSCDLARQSGFAMPLGAALDGAFHLDNLGLAFAAFIWTCFVAFMVKREADAVWRAMLSRRPFLPVITFAAQPIAIMCPMFFASDIARGAMGIEPWRNLIGFMVIDVAYAAARWFLMCRPVAPKPKEQRARAGALLAGAR